jgi:hypothetical protein
MIASRRFAHAAGRAIAQRLGLVAEGAVTQRNLSVRRHIDALKSPPLIATAICRTSRRRAAHTRCRIKRTIGSSEKRDP